MTSFHAVLLDETRCEFGATVTAKSRAAAFEKLRADYPESRVVQLESPADTRKRQARLERQIQREYDSPGGYYGEDY